MLQHDMLAVNANNFVAAVFKCFIFLEADRGGHCLEHKLVKRFAA